jgi:hypothetical protein
MKWKFNFLYEYASKRTDTIEAATKHEAVEKFNNKYKGKKTNIILVENNEF